MTGHDTQQRILAAALTCFTEHGVHGTTVEQVRRHAGVSNGSFFHHFRTKQDLAEAVYLHGLEEHQGELLRHLTPRTGLRAGIEGTVRRHLAWVADHPELTAFLLGPPGWTTPRDVPHIAVANRAFFTAIADWLHTHGWTDTPPLDVIVALWIGPAQEYTRRLLLTGSTATDSASATLAAAAWRALEPLLTSPDRTEREGTAR